MVDMVDKGHVLIECHFNTSNVMRHYDWGATDGTDMSSHSDCIFRYVPKMAASDMYGFSDR